MRKRSGLSVRNLAELADVSPAMISYAERGVNSLGLVTLQKVLTALGTSMAEFFTEKDSAGVGPVFAREQMRVVSDPARTYTMLLSNRPGVKLEMLDEHIRYSKKKPEYSKLKSDVAGYILSGILVLDVKTEPSRLLRAGDAFYLIQGVSHRGYAPEGREAHLITAFYPASY